MNNKTLADTRRILGESVEMNEDKSTPKETYTEQKEKIVSLLKSVNEGINSILNVVEKNLEKDSDSWAFIGRGAELSSIIKYLNDVNDTVKGMK